MSIRRVALWFFVMGVVGSATSCLGEQQNGPCQFRDPQSVVRLEDIAFRVLTVLRHRDDDRFLLIMDRIQTAGRDQIAFKKVDLTTGAITNDVIPHKENTAWPPEGYVGFQSPPQKQAIHYEYLGKTVALPFLQFEEKRRVSVDREKVFTGTRRIMYGTRPLVEQNFVKRREGDDVENEVAVDPVGDRLVCLCVDMRAAWFGVFSKKKIDAQQVRRVSSKARQ